MKNQKVHHSSDRKDWATPKELFNKLIQDYNFTLDVCATKANAKVPTYYNSKQDGLKKAWHTGQDRVNWCNPPYGDPEAPCKEECSKKICKQRGHHNRKYKPGITDWIEKALKECLERGARTVLLLPSRTDTAYFHRFIWDKETNAPHPWAVVHFYQGRVKFEGAPHSAPFPSVIVEFNPALISDESARRNFVRDYFKA